MKYHVKDTSREETLLPYIYIYSMVCPLDEFQESSQHCSQGPWPSVSDFNLKESIL